MLRNDQITRPMAAIETFGSRQRRNTWRVGPSYLWRLSRQFSHTIWRDLEALELAGFPSVTENANGQTWRRLMGPRIEAELLFSNTAAAWSKTSFVNHPRKTQKRVKACTI